MEISKPKKITTLEQQAELWKLYNSGVPKIKIAKIFELHVSSVTYWIDKIKNAGIKKTEYAKKLSLIPIVQTGVLPAVTDPRTGKTILAEEKLNRGKNYYDYLRKNAESLGISFRTY